MFDMLQVGTAWALGVGGEAGKGGEGGIGGLLSGPLPMLVLMFVIFYFLLIRPQQKKAKAQREMIASLKKGDQVMTNGGIYGLIEDIDEKTATLKVGIKDDVKIKINRSYIAGIRDKEQS